MKCFGFWGALALMMWAGSRAEAGLVELYATGFESVEGYDLSRDLDGQKGWVSLMVSNNGNTGLLVADPGLGDQSAYIGFQPDGLGEERASVWHPLEMLHNLAQIPLVKFSVTLSIVDSLEFTNRDDFCWEVFNQDDELLFTLIFGNSDLTVYYLLESGTNIVSTGFEFINDRYYALEMELDFERNLWLARVDGKTIVTNQPISELGSALNLSDIDAGWFYADPTDPGDNFMIFDEYRIWGVPESARPGLKLLRRLEDGRAVLQLSGLPDCAYALEASADLVNWTTLATLVGGVVEFTDPQGASFPHRFYRAHVVP